MADAFDALTGLDSRHIEALEWFNMHRGSRISWAEIKAHADGGARLVNQAKGIYKPEYTHYALSVRTIQEGPYPDKEVEYRTDGTWVCQYYQENPDPSKRDREATNRGLVSCMNDRVPVGFLVKRKPKPGVEYDVLGLGYVVEWSGGYFTIEGMGIDRRFHEVKDAARARASSGTVEVPVEDFMPAGEAEKRERIVASVATRRGQASFRARLLEAYGGRCCVTGCDLHDALEAAHISPYSGPQSNHPQNGLLLRADIHTLFDLGLLSVDAEMMLVIAPALHRSEAYRGLAGQRLNAPIHPSLSPSCIALARHREWAGL